ncbi:DUF5703 family protein [Haloechinothrix sp. LS1_15]|uniref:DUF5703 family protein n=1 Tax=Haloechinothrix sp. LS1_15 TaxID=2652248 RepID=UPI002948615C|nr:DUF5703 family protein [Haloechinothrix sp. LS1_15]MDV6014043.1 hypothetical protein [Haloechinothrix sp. LS1_15]
MSEAARDESDSDETSHSEGRWEYQKLRLPPGVSRPAAMTQLSIHAEYSGWELSTVRLYADGSRRVWLRRRYQPALCALSGVVS